MEGFGFLRSFSPVAGIQWVETVYLSEQIIPVGGSFSPVAGIQWVETPFTRLFRRLEWCVSVPLPGFSGLRQPLHDRGTMGVFCFSPVAGIQWVETIQAIGSRLSDVMFQSRCRDSVG